MRHTPTPSFVTEIPLRVDSAAARTLGVRFDCARMVYNACLGEALRRLDLMRQSKVYQRARALPKQSKEQQKARAAAFTAADVAHGFREYDLHAWAARFTHSWLGPHLDANTIQTLASRAFRATAQHAFGKRGKPRFKGPHQLDSLEGKSNKQGLRWVADRLVWKDLQVPGIIDRRDPVIAHGLRSRVKYVRLVRRKLNGVPRYYAQLVCEGVPYRKPANCVGDGVIGCDPGPRVFTFTGAGWAVRVDLTNKADQRAIRQLQRAVDRRRRANNPANYLPDGRIKPGRHAWKISARQKRAERQRAEIQRKAAATRTTRHGRLVNKLLRRGNVIQVERNSYKSFQRNFGRSVGHAAPGGFVRLLERKAASAGAQVHRLPTTLRLSQVCHGCGEINKKVLSLRVHQCACGVGPVQRDIYSAFLAQCATAIEGLDGPEWHLDAARAAIVWAGMELCLSAASGLLAVEEFTASQPANVSSPGEARLLAQASGIERVADAGAPPGREAPDAVRQRKRDGEPGKAQRPVPGTPRA